MTADDGYTAYAESSGKSAVLYNDTRHNETA